MDSVATDMLTKLDQIFDLSDEIGYRNSNFKRLIFVCNSILSCKIGICKFYFNPKLTLLYMYSSKLGGPWGGFSQIFRICNFRKIIELHTFKSKC